MKHTYLLTYYYTNDEEVYSSGYIWLKNIEEVKDKIESLKERHENFYIDEVLRVIDVPIYENYYIKTTESITNLFLNG